MVKAAIANGAWLAASAPSWLAFKRALDDPARAQEKRLAEYVRNGADTAFGNEHGFAEIKTYEQFARRVPIRDYDELEPWIDRIKHGEQRVLTLRPVRRLVPTSGSTAARKLIPYTDESHREFQRAVGPWIFDLHRGAPRGIAGPSYWSVTPQGQCDAFEQTSAVPIGFDSDSEYLGGWFRRMVNAAMVVPAELNRIASIDVLRYVTLLLLLRRRDLTLMSVWHPSFLELLLRELNDHFDRLVNDISEGTCDVIQEIPISLHRFLHSRPDAQRAKEIQRAGAKDISALWPRLHTVSCWAHGHAESAAAALAMTFPGVTMQPKGLLATEGVVSIPFAGKYPLAIRSHFFEFIDSTGSVALASDLRVGHIYDVVLTTAGGLWRYRLGDRVRVTGVCRRTPTIRFLGKLGLISDRMGEKLAEGFVANVLARLFTGSPSTPTFSLLAPDSGSRGLHYTLHMNHRSSPRLAESLDELLAENPQYAYCRKLGQLRAPRIFQITGDAYAAYCNRLTKIGQRLGDIKAVSLSPLDAWPDHFEGSYEQPVADSSNS